MVELKNLKHVTTIHLYQEQFEALMNKVELSEAYEVSLFIGGLKDEISMPVRMFKPNTLTNVYCLAKMQEATLQVLKTKQFPLLSTPKAPYTNANSYANRSMTYTPKTTTTSLALPVPPNTRTNGQLFSLEICVGGSNSEDYGLEEFLEEQVVQNFRESIVEAPLISLHSMTRESTYKIMRVKAYVRKHTVHSLINFGSIHTLLDLRVAKKLGCELKATCVEFTSDVLILPLGGCEMVLRVQWLSILEDIKWNFKDLAMDFVYNNKRMALRETQKSTLQWMCGKRHPKEAKSLQTDHDVFATPTSLPPKRKQDHRIPLLPDTPPINIRLYKHPPNQKDDVEAMKDDTWRMCIDYRQLNKYTIKDKFPIPVVEELLDELNGAHFFSKLDLILGYHQIRMHEDDIEKTAFRTHKGHYEFLVMPFGLTNAPSTFQSLMNICYIGRTFATSSAGFQAMKQNSLYAKMSKCIFAAKQVEYLGHIISGKEVSTDPSKIIAMQKWPTPANVKQLRGFLGLTGYYRRFIRNYAIISKPLTTILKKNSFAWNPSAQAAFEELKLAMIQAPVLALPDFNQPFIVETDALGIGIRAVLQQGGHPIAYLSKSLSLNTRLPLQPKIPPRPKINYSFQAKWLPKLLGYDYEISYKKGSENTIADALSRISSCSELCSLILSIVTSDLLQQIKNSWVADVDLQLLIMQIEDRTYTGTKYTWTNRELRRKGKLVVGSDEQLRKTLMTYFHCDPIGGHSSVQVTIKKIGIVLYWRCMKKLTKKFFAECDVCQRNNLDWVASPGLLQPLPIPTKAWHDISVDFIEALPPSQGKTVLFVVVDKLSKYAYFIPMSHPFTASQVA
ncbi:transposon ty3-I gag-pol polyprotein [Tanacetum coccineum]